MEADDGVTAAVLEGVAGTDVEEGDGCSSVKVAYVK